MTKAKNNFFRTIACNDRYCTAVAHDGRGNNMLYVLSSGLKLLANKHVIIKKQDYSFNISTLLSTNLQTVTSTN